MTFVERYLKDYWFAARSIGRLMLDLDAAKAAYEDACGYLPSAGAMNASGVKTQRGDSPVEISAILAVQQYKAEAQSIARRLRDERETMRRIELVVAAAGLSARETAYVRLRYFENRSVQAVCQRLYCSAATCGRTREAVLEKLSRVLPEAAEA